MNREKRLLLIYEQVDLEKQPVALQDNQEITDYIRGFLYRINPNLMKTNSKDVYM